MNSLESGTAAASAPRRRTVLVTGASTGIGRKIAQSLADAGHLVFAGARKRADLDALGAIANVVPLRLDVTDERDIARAAETVAAVSHELYGLVNNAGIATLGSVAEGDERDFELTLAVNMLGTYRVTRKFAPLIRAASGRIVTIGSIAGILTERNVGAYSMSKHALEAFTDVLALEMEPFGVQVSIVEPGGCNTALVRNAAARLGNDAHLPDLSTAQEPDAVATQVALALFSDRPRRRYLIVSSEAEARKTITSQIEQLVQLNRGHPYAYDRDRLVTMLDDALSRSR